MLDRVLPGVVNISAVSRVRMEQNPLFNDPFFRQFFGFPGAPRERQVQSLGSGVIVDADRGLIVTTNHVTKNADQIAVTLLDGRQFEARVVASEPAMDLSVARISARNLTAVPFGDSGALRVGDFVVAIGNPFGLGQTVTSGIVSALGRSGISRDGLEDFIQTDAAINPGNSGGALVDVAGNLLGINTAIYSRTGGSLGIGFAIPVSTARQVMESLIKDGRVTRGWIGVEPRDLTPEIARTLDLSVKQGVLITGVVQSGPASEGGLRPGDVVLKIGDASIANTPQLLNAVAALKPHETTTVSVQRGGSALDVKVTVGQRPPSRPATIER